MKKNIINITVLIIMKNIGARLNAWNFLHFFGDYHHQHTASIDESEGYIKRLDTMLGRLICMMAYGLVNRAPIFLKDIQSLS